MEAGHPGLADSSQEIPPTALRLNVLRARGGGGAHRYVQDARAALSALSALGYEVRTVCGAGVVRLPGRCLRWAEVACAASGCRGARRGGGPRRGLARARPCIAEPRVHGGGQMADKGGAACDRDRLS